MENERKVDLITESLNKSLEELRAKRQSLENSAFILRDNLSAIEDEVKSVTGEINDIRQLIKEMGMITHEEPKEEKSSLEKLADKKSKKPNRRSKKIEMGSYNVPEDVLNYIKMKIRGEPYLIETLRIEVAEQFRYSDSTSKIYTRVVLKHLGDIVKYTEDKKFVSMPLVRVSSTQDDILEQQERDRKNAIDISKRR